MHKDLREIHVIGSRSREWRLAVAACPAMGECGILWLGWTEAAGGFRFVRHRPRFSGLIACQSGHGHVWQEDRWQGCGPGTAYLLPEGACHGYFANPRGKWRICWVAFERGAIPALEGGEARLVRADTRPLQSAIEGLQWETTGPAGPSAVRNWLELIRFYAVRISGPVGEDPRLGRVWEQVDADLSHGWSLPELADLAGMSGENLRRLCQSHLRCSPMRHVTHLRIRRAAALLVSTSQKVATIARAVGYDNPFAFSASFSRLIGTSPAAYRAGKGLGNR